MAEYIQFTELPAVQYNAVRWKLPKPQTIFCPCCETACRLSYIDKNEIISWVAHCVWCDFRYVVSGDKEASGEWGNALQHARLRGLFERVPSFDDPARSEEVRDDLVSYVGDDRPRATFDGTETWFEARLRSEHGQP
jgi:hypothetical protein